MWKARRVAAASATIAITGVMLVTTSPLSARDGAHQDSLPTGLLSTVAAVDASGHPGTTAFDAISPNAIVMGEGKGQSVAGWSELGRLSTSLEDGGGYGEMRHLQSIGDRLVVIGSTFEPDEGPSHDVVYQSTDGITWLPASVPGRNPRFKDLASAGDSLVLGGFDRVAGQRRARLWTSPDGVEWKRLRVPRRLKRIDQIVSAGTQDTPLAVRGGKNLWARRAGDGWGFVTKLIDMPIQHGPGGYLASQFPNRILLHWGDDLASIREVPLPKAMGRNEALLADAQLFPLEGRWLLVPHVATNPDTIYESRDGLTWTTIPRPPGILAGAVRWMADIGDVVQAFGAVDGDDGDEGGIWTFEPGEPVGQAATMDGSDEFIDAPVLFGDHYAASGLKMGQAWELTSWERSAEMNQ